MAIIYKSREEQVYDLLSTTQLLLNANTELLASIKFWQISHKLKNMYATCANILNTFCSEIALSKGIEIKSLL